MKTMMILGAFISLITLIALISAAMTESRRLVANECQVNHYACYKPAVSFANLR
jgi:hypothetical protein